MSLVSSEEDIDASLRGSRKPLSTIRQIIATNNNHRIMATRRRGGPLRSTASSRAPCGLVGHHHRRGEQRHSTAQPIRALPPPPLVPAPRDAPPPYAARGARIALEASARGSWLAGSAKKKKNPTRSSPVRPSSRDGPQRASTPCRPSRPPRRSRAPRFLFAPVQLRAWRSAAQHS